MQVRIVELDGGLDPDEYCKERGAAAYQERVDGAKGYFYWLADRARAKHDMRTSEGKVAVLNFLLPKVQNITDQLERMTIANDVAGYIGVDRGMVLDHFRKAVSERSEKAIERPKSPLRHDERMLLIALLTDAELRAEMIGPLRSLQTIDTLPSRRIFQAIFALEEAGGRVGFDESQRKTGGGRPEPAGANRVERGWRDFARGGGGGGGKHATQRTAEPARAVEDAHQRIGARRPVRRSHAFDHGIAGARTRRDARRSRMTGWHQNVRRAVVYNDLDYSSAGSTGLQWR